MDDQTLFRAAGLSAALAIPLLAIAGITIALFFGGQGAFWGPVNDIFTALTALALLLPIVAVDRLAADTVPWMRAVSIVAFAGCVLIAVGQLALVAGIITLQSSFVTGGVGFLGLLVWFVALVILSFGAGVLPTPIGWSSVALLALVIVEAVVAMAAPGVGLWIASLALVGIIVAWLGTLAAGFLAHGTA